MAQTANILQIVSIAFFALAGVALVIAIIIFFYLKIPKVIGDLSGKTARESIRQLREGNEKSGAKGPNMAYDKNGANLNAAPGPVKGNQAGYNAKGQVPSSPQNAASIGNPKPVSSAAPKARPRPMPINGAGMAQAPAPAFPDTEQRSYYEGSNIPETGLLKESRAGSETDLSQTTLLNESEETTWLNTSEETTLLEETAELGTAPSQRGVVSGNVALELIEEIMLIHTDEEI